MKTCALIVAGGSGSRMGTDIPKQFLVLKDRPVLIHTLEKFLAFDPEMHIVLVLNSSCNDLWESAAYTFLSKAEKMRIHICLGGETRTESVHNGLQLLESLLGDPAEFLVAIHDAVRPLIYHELLERCFKIAARNGASVACVPVKSSLRQKTENGSEAVDRSQFYHVQTPQTFQLDLILQAFHQRSGDDFTDDASLFQAAGGNIEICEGDYKNLKITTPEDLFVAERLIKKL